MTLTWDKGMLTGVKHRPKTDGAGRGPRQCRHSAHCGGALTSVFVLRHVGDCLIDSVCSEVAERLKVWSKSTGT